MLCRIWQSLCPRLQAVEDFLKEPNVPSVVSLHLLDGLALPTHTAFPQVETRVWKLAAYIEIGTKIIEFVGKESEFRACQLKGVVPLDVGARREIVLDKSSVGLTAIEAFAVMCNHEIGLRYKRVEFFAEPVIIFGIGLLEICYCFCVYFLFALPLIGKG